METLVVGFGKGWAFQKCIHIQLSKKYERKYIATLTIGSNFFSWIFHSSPRPLYASYSINLVILAHTCSLLCCCSIRYNGAPTNNESYDQCVMTTPFTGEEIYEPAKSMKNGKSSWIEEIHARHVGNPPDELNIDFLTPLPKHGR